MRTFEALNHTWSIAIDPLVIEQVRSECGVDLGDRKCGQFDVLTSDSVKTSAVLWAICREQAEAREVSRAVFLKALHADCGEQALHALIEANIDFFPRAQQAVLRDLLRQSMEVDQAVSEAARSRIANSATSEAMKRQALEKLNAELDKILPS